MASKFTPRKWLRPRTVSADWTSPCPLLGKEGVAAWRAVLIVVAPLAVAVLAAGDGTVLLDDGFEAGGVGRQPAGWPCFADVGNSIAIADQHALGQRSLKLTRSGGTAWKPMVSGQISGQPNSSLQFEFDACVGALSDRWDDAFIGWLRGEVNQSLVEIALGGPGGVAVRGERGEWLALDFPLEASECAHVRVVADPLTRGKDAVFELTVTQGEERLRVPNILFRRLPGAYPANWWYSPTFHLGGGSAEHPREAWVDNVKLVALPAG
ncbi:MAG: hypothetical protein HYU66_27420 [Armatimonadetes bacterium]|nr:hypothetical protein [Armatimonadota bacterium]